MSESDSQLDKSKRRSKKFQRTLRPPPRRTIVQTPRPIQLPAVAGAQAGGAPAAAQAATHVVAQVGAPVGAPVRVGATHENAPAKLPLLPQLAVRGRVEHVPPQQPQRLPPQQPYKELAATPREDLAMLPGPQPVPPPTLHLPGLVPTRAGFGQSVGAGGAPSPLKSSLKPTKPPGERTRVGGGRRVRVREAAMEDDLQWFKKNTPRGALPEFGGIRAEYQMMASMVTV